MRMTPTKKITMGCMLVTFVIGCFCVLLALRTNDPDPLKVAMVGFATGNLLGILGVKLRNF